MSHAHLLFRPECLEDIENLKIQGEAFGISPNRYVQVNPDLARDTSSLAMMHQALGGAVFAFEASSAEEVASLILAMSHVVDGHRMLQTLDEKEHFTGDAFRTDHGRIARISDLLTGSSGKIRARDIFMEFNPDV